MNKTIHRGRLVFLSVSVALLGGSVAQADVITEWNVRADNIVAAAKLPTPLTCRIMALVQSVAYEAVNGITGRYPEDRVRLGAPPTASIDAAVAGANHAMLSKLLPSQEAAIDSAYQAALSAIPNDPSRAQGIAVGEKAAEAILALRADDGAAAPENYRPVTTAGVYVPTVLPAVPQWPQRKSWLMTTPDQFRPGPPPRLDSDQWARDYNETKDLGAKASVHRTAEQTSIARFWDATGTRIYFPLVRSVAGSPGREVTRNARLFAAAAQAMDDALIAIFDAKYHYGFWRPITAIRNGDIDGNDGTQHDSSWLPFVDTPMHPEYPCAHCCVAAALGAVLEAEIGAGPTPKLEDTSPTAPGVVRSWTRIDDFVKEVANARIYDGVHYRNSTEVGSAMGKKVGELAAEKLLH